MDPTKAGGLDVISRAETGGAGACHVSVSPTEDFVTVSNYGGGSVSAFPINQDTGALGSASDFHQYTGGSHAVADRQDAAHLHSMTWVGNGSHGVFGADLGNDRIVQFAIDPSTGKLVERGRQAFIARPSGAGPRHMAIHPNQRTAAAIRVSANGRFVYSSNRGHNSIAIFSIDQSGKLSLVGHEPSGGKTPRDFIVHDGFLLVANQDSHNLVVFRVDASTGKLRRTGHSAACGTPVSLFMSP
ncbi:hypothetical protein PINS_up002696 [Pythium insidiosum]|nr:hypothetical protein PINS_up002696 [Pythium insidiosum]